MATIDLMDRFGNLGDGGIKNNGVLDAEVQFQPALRTMRTDFIQVKAGDSIVYKNMNGMSSIWNILSFYTGDAQGFYVSGIAGQTTPQSGVWTAAQDGYVRLFGSFPAGDKISVTMTDLAPDVEDYLSQYNAMNYRFLPNSIPKIVAHIQEYLSNHPIADSTTLQAVIDAAFQSYMEEIQQTADTYIAEAVPPAAAAAVDAAASPALAEITSKAAEAAESARQAGLSQQSAEMSEENALTYRNQAQQIKDSITAEVAASVQAAQEQATLAQESAQAADQSSDTAEQYVAQARAQAAAAADHAQTASGYASDAQGYAQNASDFADNAAQSAATFTTDPTLTIAGKAADAKATGDELSSLKSALEVEATLPGWEKGSFNTTNGANYTDNSRIRNQTKVGVSTGVQGFTLTDGYSTLMFAWDLSGNYVGAYKTDGTWTKTASGWKSVTEFDLSTVPNYVIKLTMARVPSSADITPDEGSNAIFYSYTDDTLTKDGKAADAKKVGDELGNLSNALEDVKGAIHPWLYLPIDETQFVSGYINRTGGISSSDAYKTSPYLRCAMIRIKFNALTKDNISIAFYSDNEGTLVGSYTNTTALSEYPTHEMDVPSGTKYIRIAKQISSAYVGSVAPYVISKENVEILDERIDSIKDEVDALTPASILADVYREVVDDRNLVDNTAYTPHTYVNNSGEIKTILNPSSQDYGLSLSDYIPVIEGKVIYLNNKFMTANYWAYYDETKTWLGGKSQYPAWGDHLGIRSHIVPTGAAYLRVTSYTEDDAQALWASYTGAEPTGEVINASDDEYIDYHYYPTNPCDYNGEEISVFNNIVCIGDSITSGYFNAASDSQSIAKYAYPAFLKKLTGVETTNKGDAGETSVSWWAAHSSDDFSGYDSAIINLGINDVLTSVSEADTRSAFASIISALKTANTGIKIFIANINPAYSRGNATYDAINEVIEDIATTTANCYFIDLTQYGHTVGVAYADGHLTACGYLRLAQDYKAAISWIIKNDPVGFRYVQFIGTNLQPAT